MAYFTRSALMMLAVAVAPVIASAQVVACDFDIADDLGLEVFGNTLRLSGRPGASTNVGQFVLINANIPEMDVDKDGYATACDFNNLIIPTQFKQNLINVDDPSRAIPAQNVIITNMPRRLASGQVARVNVAVELPPGTVAGVYRGTFQVRDEVRFVTVTPSAEILNLDFIQVEVTVVEQRSFTLVDPERAEALDSVVVRGRAGQRASSVFRLANTGNTPLTDLQFSVSDLRSESAIGLVIPATNVQFSPPSLSGLGIRDTARITVTVQIPRGILGGRYRGTITVQGAGGTDAQSIPIIVIVTSTRGILFANNPARDVAEIAFNGDPGTPFQVGIFDMSGLMVFVQTGNIFAGVDGTLTNPTTGADFAASVTWPLINGRGENVASGMYIVAVESIVNGKRQLARDRLMVIR